MSEEATEESLAAEMVRLEANVSDLTRQLGAVSQKQKDNAENAGRMKHLTELIEARRKEAEGWGRLSALFGSADGKKFRNIAQSYVLRQLLSGANHYLARLTDRYRMECQPGSLTILLRDEYEGGVCRPTSTISGGESFLISLSLALGLSSLNRKSKSVGRHLIHRRGLRHARQRLPEHRDGCLGAAASDGGQEGRHHQSCRQSARADPYPDSCRTDKQYAEPN